MPLKNYTVRFKDGSTIPIEGVASVEHDGAGRRFKDADGAVIAGFSDGEVSAHWPSTATITPAPAPPE